MKTCCKHCLGAGGYHSRTCPSPKPAHPCRHCRLRERFRCGLCKTCYDVTAVRRLYPSERRTKLADPCRHCRKREVCRGHGLCSVCHSNRTIRARYPDGRTTRQDAPEDRKAARRERKPGQPFWRCLWCSRYRCHQPLKICGGCQKKYEERMKTCPPWANGEH